MPQRERGMPVSNMPATSNPHGVIAGASTATLAHVPTWPARLHLVNGSVQAVSQQTLSAQKPVPHCEGVEHAPPTETGVLVGVGVITKRVSVALLPVPPLAEVTKLLAFT
jgi:hypothetical protein